MKRLVLFACVCVLVASSLLSTHATPATAAPYDHQSEPTITWLVPELTQIIFPGASTRVIASFVNYGTRKLTDVRVVIGEHSLKRAISVEPQNFPVVVPRQKYEFTVTFSAPPNFKTDEPLTGDISLIEHKPTGILSPPLPIRLTIDPAVEQDFSVFAQELRAGNIDGVLKRFSPEKRARAKEILKKMTTEERNEMASRFTQARLVSGTDDLQVYEIHHTEGDGAEIVTEFTLSRIAPKEWVIISW